MGRHCAKRIDIIYFGIFFGDIIVITPLPNVAKMLPTHLEHPRFKCTATEVASCDVIPRAIEPWTSFQSSATSCL